MDKKIRLGIIGVGNMGSGHARNVLGGKCPDFELTAIADINPARLRWAKEELSENLECFSDAIQMLDSGHIDAAMVCVPHYDHAKYAIACMERGIHVMCEKPAGVYTLQAREMNAAGGQTSGGRVWNDVQPANELRLPQDARAGAFRQVRANSARELADYELVSPAGVL